MKPSLSLFCGLKTVLLLSYTYEVIYCKVSVKSYLQMRRNQALDLSIDPKRLKASVLISLNMVRIAFEEHLSVLCISMMHFWSLCVVAPLYKRGHARSLIYPNLYRLSKVVLLY